MRSRKPLSHRSGAALVEFALIFPLILILMVGIWEVGRMIEVQQAVSNAAREGGRQASTGQRTAGQVQTAVLNYLSNTGISTAGTTVTVTNITSPGLGDPTSANQLHRLRVAVAVPFSNVRWIAMDWFVAAGSNITSQADWFSMKDIPLEVNPTMPIE